MSRSQLAPVRWEAGLVGTADEVRQMGGAAIDDDATGKADRADGAASQPAAALICSSLAKVSGLATPESFSA